MHKVILSLLLLVTISLPLSAAHITDKLLVGFYAQQDLSGDPVILLESDTPLDVLERNGQVAKVRLADNSEGWLETRYISEEKPVRMVLLETQAELRQLKARTAAQEDDDAVEQKLKKDLLAAQVRIAKLERDWEKSPKTQALKQYITDIQNTLQQMVQLTSAVKPKGDVSLLVQKAKNYLPWLVGILALGIGIIAGMAYTRYRVRKRYSGLRL